MSNSNSGQSARAAAKERRRRLRGGAQNSAAATGASPSRARSASAGKASEAGSNAAKLTGRMAARAYRQRQLGGNEAHQTDSAAEAPRASQEVRESNAAPASSDHTPAERRSGAPKRGRKRRVQPKVDAVGDAGRMMARARRAAQSRGKSFLDAQKKGGSTSAASLMKLANPSASGKEVAKQVRRERCKGKKCAPKPQRAEAGRKAKRTAAAPNKVGISETGSGQHVTGNLVGQNQATGTEAGLCSKVSGTEYMSAEDYREYCHENPQPAVGKGVVTRTGKGQSVSGTTVGRSAKVSGDLAGQCASVTGTEYLPADQAEMFCGAQSHSGRANAAARPRRKDRTATSSRESVTGGDVSTHQKVTGSRHSNGMNDLSASASGRRKGGAPKKVVTSTTATGAHVTGTQVGGSTGVTGDEAGFCKNVTGNGYQGVEDREQRCDTPPVSSGAKVLPSATFSGQRITGDRAGLGEGITGAEAGTCQKVTGTPYVGAEGARQQCEPEQFEAIERSVKRRHRDGGFSISGTQPGPAGMTGMQKGVCESVSGTPYQGQDQMSAFCAPSNKVAEVGDLDFPQQVATGGAASAGMGEGAGSSALTGSFSQAEGKVTGGEMGASLRSRRGSAAMAEKPAAQAAEAAAYRVTGEGAQSGFSITGDAWNKGDRVTGTEGAWAQGRNPSMRGTVSQPTAIANDYRPVIAPETPDSLVSGSSGNTSEGAKVTVSGGARA